MYFNRLPIIFISLIFIAITSWACERRQTVRSYEEINIESPLKQLSMPMGGELPEGHPPIGDTRMDMAAASPQQQEMFQDSVADVDLIWNVPQGWIEEKGSGMRLVTFRSGGTDRIECSVVSLSGVAGGLEANIARWLGQMGKQDFPAEQLAKIITDAKNISSVGGFSVRVIDLIPLAQSSTDQAILGGVIQDQDKTIFIKMTGSKDALLRERSAFESLCRSLASKK